MHRKARRLMATATVALLALCGGCRMSMPGQNYVGELPPADRDEQLAADRMRQTVEVLAGTIGQRNVFNPDKLEAAARYLEGSLRQLGYQPQGQVYSVRDVPCRNIDVEIPGLTRPDEIVLIGAHYDAVHGCPAANDNGSGVAGVLEIARQLKSLHPDRTIRFVLFVNEEPPFFLSSEMGSRVYARRCKQRHEKIVAMLSLETIGYYRDDPGSQHYLPPFNAFYPSEGNFIAFVSNFASRDLLTRCVESFRRNTAFPSQGAAMPDLIQGIGWSDHWSFWQEGYHALMVTDTAPYRYPHYHQPTDTPEKLDYIRMAKVVLGLTRVTEELARVSQEAGK